VTYNLKFGQLKISKTLDLKPTKIPPIVPSAGRKLQSIYLLIFFIVLSSMIAFFCFLDANEVKSILAN
jgi:hypothetical protein